MAFRWIHVGSGVYIGVSTTNPHVRSIRLYNPLLVVCTFGHREWLTKHHVLQKIAYILEGSQSLPSKLLIITFFLSMVVTNDVVILSMVPLTLVLNIPRKAWIIILETLAANAGSSISPIGNPQNLFLYWHYGIPFWKFIRVISPFSLLTLAVLLLLTFVISKDSPDSGVSFQNADPGKLPGKVFFYFAALFVFILSIARIFPLWSGVVVLVGIFLLERGPLHADYMLIATFAAFFGFTDNLNVLFRGIFMHSHHVFLLSSLLSQVISNVPAALLVADFTDQWKPLLWGVSVGGFGSLLGSMANLIAYRLYQKSKEGKDRVRFLIRFHVISYGMFFMGWLIYWVVRG